MDIEPRQGAKSPPDPGAGPDPEAGEADASHWPVSAFVTALSLGVALVLLLVTWLMTAKTSGVTVSSDALGTLALWVAGVGTLAAVFAAMYVFSREQRHTRQALRNGLESLEVNRRSLALQLESRDMEQAAKVAAWISCRARGERDSPLWTLADDRLDQAWAEGQHEFRARMGSDFRPAESHHHPSAAPGFADLLRRFGDSGPANSAWIVLTCQNISNQPVFDVRVDIVGDTADSVARSLSWPMWSPETPVFHERIISNDGEHFVLNLEEAASLSKSWRPRISFTDSASRRWLRTEEGRLLLRNER